MLTSLFFIVTGFTALIFGANWLVDGASALARKFKVSDLAIGLTIVAFGTSAPELVVNIFASVNNHSDIVLGNIIGSNNFNLFIILGLAGIIFPISVQSSTAWKEIPISLLVTVLFLVLANDFFLTDTLVLGLTDGLILLVLFLLFLMYVFTQLKADSSETELHASLSTFKMSTLILGGLAGLIIGGQLVVNYSIDIAHVLGVSEKIIGLTIVAAGTSLPELVTSIVAATKKNSDIAIGNVIGSNIFNILLILSLSSIINPISYSAVFNTDLYILLGGTIFLLIAMLTGTRKRLDRWEAGLLFISYLAYTVYLVRLEL
ncbi:calcium/sodium antiporter [bacterium]|nr:MAG: calcium/sodium antiporter [bacterium]